MVTKICINETHESIHVRKKFSTHENKYIEIKMNQRLNVSGYKK